MTDRPVHHLDLGSERIAWRRVGAGPDLLLVHGWPLHGLTWDAVLPHLAPRFTCWVPDLAGLGLSEWGPDTDFGFAGHARRLRGFVDAMGLTRYAIMAQDTGATVARLLAVDDAARVSGLVLLNTEMPGHRPPWIPLYRTLAGLPGAGASFALLLRSRTYLRSSLGFGGCFFDRGRIDDAFVARYVRPLADDARRRDGMLRYLRGVDWSVVDSLADVHRCIRAPVRLVWGAADPTFPIEPARSMVRQFAGRADLVEIPHACLLAHEEQPIAVAQATLDFLSEPGQMRA
jgi:pimeloyl-ACP methyl ester carboxylesterase